MSTLQCVKPSLPATPKKITNEKLKEIISERQVAENRHEMIRAEYN